MEQLEWYYAPPMCECPLCWDVPDWKGEAVFQGDVLRGLRLGHGLSQSELAKSMRVSRRTIAYWEHYAVGSTPLPTGCRFLCAGGVLPSSQGSPDKVGWALEYPSAK